MHKFTVYVNMTGDIYRMSPSLDLAEFLCKGAKRCLNFSNSGFFIVMSL